MNLKVVMLAVLIVVGCIMSPRSFAQDYQQVNIFNRFSDWTVTIGKSQDEKQRIINERIANRARQREAWDRDHGRAHDIQAKKDQENRDHENRKADLQNRYKNDPDTLNKKLQDEDNDHNNKMRDFDNQR